MITPALKFHNKVVTGVAYDQTTGLYYLNARYYHPEDHNLKVIIKNIETSKWLKVH